MSCFLFCFRRIWVLETLPGSQSPALTSNTNRKSSPPFCWQSQAHVRGCDLRGGLLSTAWVYDWEACRLQKLGKTEPKWPHRIWAWACQIQRTHQGLGCGPAWTGTHGLHPSQVSEMGKYQIEPDEKQEEAELPLPAGRSQSQPNGVCAQMIKSLSLMTQPKKYSRLAWKNNSML